jgi:hypothetical protein
LASARRCFIKIWITKPHQLAPCKILTAFESAWARALKELRAVDPGAEFEIISSNPGEIHGELLTRLWITRILPSKDSEHLISEIDFVPNKYALLRLQSTADAADARLLGTIYCTRSYPEPKFSTTASKGKIKAHHTDASRSTPLLAPHFLYINLDSSHLPRENWLAQGGPFNDAANLGIQYALEDGFLRNDKAGQPLNYAFFAYRDGWPLVHGLFYPRVGWHTYFGGYLADPALDKVICWSDNHVPLTAGTHQANVSFLLRKLGHAT